VRVPLQDEALDAQVKTYTDPMLAEYLPRELQFIKTVGGLTDGETALVDEAGRSLIHRLAEEIKSAIFAHGVKVIVADGRQFMLPAGFDRTLVTSPREFLRGELRKAAQEKLPEAWKKLDDDEARRDAMRRSARVRMFVALVDEALMLSSQQRNDLCQRLSKDGADAVWRPMASGTLPNPATDRLYAALAGEPLGSFDLPEEWKGLLSKPQLAVLKEIQETPLPKTIALRQGLQIQVRAAGNLRVIQQRAIAVRDVKKGSRANPRDPVADDRERRLARYIEQRVDQIDAACSLSAAQREKLLLAGKLDLLRLREQSPPPEEPLAQAVIVAQQVRIMGGDSAPLPLAIFSDAASYFQKSLQGRLGDEQKDRLAAAERERREFHRQAMVAAVVVGFERAAILTADQCDELSTALDKALGEIESGSMASVRLECLRRIEKRAWGVLRTVLYEFQQPAAAEHQARLIGAPRRFEIESSDQSVVFRGVHVLVQRDNGKAEVKLQADELRLDVE
jgi:hypothetical protein